MFEPVSDLFGEIPVTESEVFDWVAAVAPAYLSSDQAFRFYVSAWNVPDKIRRFKQLGKFDSIIATKAAPYHARLALGAIL